MTGLDTVEMLAFSLKLIGKKTRKNVLISAGKSADKDKMFPAIEKRITTNVLYVAGLCFQQSLPEVDQINYVGHVTQPTLMLNGELDFFFPAETSQKPFFELLGTPSEHKRRLTFPGGHSVPRVEMIRETLGWLDRYLGPVEQP